MNKDIKWNLLLKRPAIIFILTAITLPFLLFLIFIINTRNLGEFLKTNFNAKSVEYNFIGSFKINDASIHSSSNGGPISISSIIFEFAPLYNLFYLKTCRANFIIDSGSGSNARIFYERKEAVIKTARQILDGRQIILNRVKININGQFECDNFFNFPFDKPFSSKKFIANYNFTGRNAVLDSAVQTLSQPGVNSSLSLISTVEGGYLFISKSLPLDLFKTKLNSKFFEFGTAEIDLNFKTNTTDLSNYNSFYELHGRALNFSFIYQPFKIFLNADFIFKTEKNKIIIEEISRPSNENENVKRSARLSGYIDFKSRMLSMEFLSSNFDLSFFNGVFSKFKNFFNHYSPAGYAKIFIKIEGQIENPETYAELNLSNAMLQGDAGYKNINNINGRLNFINSKISFHNISGSLMSSKVNINGACDISSIKDGGDINIDFSEIPVTEIKDYMIFNENEIEKLISSSSEGRLTFTLKLSTSGDFKGHGSFSKCRLALQVKNEIIEISDAGGKFVLGNESIDFTDSYGFIGNVPFFFNASFSNKNLKNYNFNLKIHNIDFSEIIAGRSSYEFLNFISRIQARNKSRLELKIGSNDGIKVNGEISLKLSSPDISLYPLPFSINIENIDGGINFNYNTLTGSFELNDFDFDLKGASKILLLSFLCRSIPVSISGFLTGGIHLSQKKVITGNFGIKEGTIRYFDNNYIELFIKISDFNAFFTVQNNVINGICKLNLLSGEARLDFKSDFSSASLSSFLNFNAENIVLNEIYIQNPRLAKYFQGQLNAGFKSVFKTGGTNDKINGTVNLKNGRFLNLNRLDIISKKDIVPNRIYDFDKFNFNFSINDKKFNIESPAYDGADKQEFLEILKNINYKINL